jgi:hypothetical protein
MRIPAPAKSFLQMKTFEGAFLGGKLFRLWVAIGVLGVGPVQAQSIQTLVCTFATLCNEAGSCRTTDERMSVMTTFVIGGRDRATIAFPDARGKTQAAFVRDLGALNWQDSKFSNTMLLATNSPEAVWTRIPITLGRSEVLFGDCREAL